MRARLTCCVAPAALLAAVAASGTPASSDGASLGRGRAPAPATATDVFIGFKGTFSDPRWGGTIWLTVSGDGRTVATVYGIAPGPCEDEDFGHLLPGRDGATGPRFAITTDGRIRDNGAFATSERRAGQRRPYKPAYAVTVSGTFTGDIVRGKLRAAVETPFDRCTANASFTAKRTS